MSDDSHRGDYSSEEKLSEGWQPPRTDAEASKRFFDKHGHSPWNDAIDKRWRSLGRKIAKGSRVNMGMLRASRKRKDTDDE